MNRYNWNSPQNIPSRGYTCGYCNRSLASEKGWHGVWEANAQSRAYVFICHHCTGPTFIDHTGGQWPGVIFGNVVSEIPEKTVSDLYDEARRATGCGANTAAVLCCRKLLMHIAVAKGANAGQSFASYVDYLSANQRRSLMGSLAQYPKFTDEQKARFSARLVQWASLTGKERRELRERYKAVAQLPPERREALTQEWQQEHGGDAIARTDAHCLHRLLQAGDGRVQLGPGEGRACLVFAAEDDPPRCDFVFGRGEERGGEG